MAHLNRTLCLLSFLSIVASALGQKIVTDRKLLAGEVSPNIIASKASSFIRLLGHNVSDIASMRVSASPLRNRRDWDVEPADHSHFLTLDATGQVVMYAFQVRRYEQYHGRSRTGKQFCQNAAQAKAHLKAMATKLGIPPDSALKSFSWARDGEVADANSAGSFGGSFVDSHGKILAALSCDPQDGQLVFYVRYNSQVGPPRKPKR